MLPFLAALIAALAAILAGNLSPASAAATAETRVGASSVVVEPLVGPPEHIAAGQRLGEEPAGVVTTVATGVAANGGARLGGRIVTEDAVGDVAIRNAMRVKPEAGTFDVIGHGTPSSVSGMSASELAGAIRARPGWAGQDIRLLSCSTGCPTGNFAQSLANDLGVVVRAPSTDIFVSSRGGITFENGGGWRVFSPGG